MTDNFSQLGFQEEPRQNDDFASLGFQELPTRNKARLASIALAAGKQLRDLTESAGQELENFGIRGSNLLNAPFTGIEVPEATGANQESVGGQVGKFVGQALPFVSLGGPMAEATEAVTGLPTAMRTLWQALGQRALGTAALSAIQSPKARGLGAITGGLASLGLDVSPAIFSNLPRAAGAVITRIPSVAAGGRQFILNRIKNVLTDLKGASTPQTVRSDIFNSIKSNFDNLSEQSEQNYNKVRELGADINAPFDSSDLKNGVTSALNKLQPRIKRAANSPRILSNLEEAQDVLNGYRNFDLDSFEGADQLKQEMNKDLRDQSLMQQSPELKKIIPDLKEKLRLSTEKSASNNPELVPAWRAADEFYKTKIVPFLKEPGTNRPTMFSKIKDKENPDVENFLAHHIRPGAQRDQITKLNQLLNMAPDQKTKDLIAYDWLKRGEDEPQIFLRQFKSLGPQQQALLFPRHLSTMDELRRLSEITKVPFTKTPTEALLPGLGGIARVGIGLELLRRGEIPTATAVLALPQISTLASRAAFESPLVRKALLSQAEKRAALLTPAGIPKSRSMLSNIILGNLIRGIQ